MTPRLRPIAFALAVSAVAGLSAGVAAYAVPKIFSDETASATPSTGFASTVIARGTFAQNYTFGIPTVVTVTRKVRIKTKSGFVAKTFKFKVDSVQRAITCEPTNPCDTAVQQATVQPGGSSGWHTHPGATFVAVAQGEGTIYRAIGSLPSDEDRCRDGLCSDADRASHGPERGSGPVRRVHALRPPARDAEYGNQSRPAPAGGLPFGQLRPLISACRRQTPRLGPGAALQSARECASLSRS